MTLRIWLKMLACSKLIASLPGWVGFGRSHFNSMPVQGGGLNLFWTGMSGHESGAGGRVCLVIPTRVRMRHTMSSPEDWRSSSENGSLLLGKAIL
jgi:hypothetical protein